MKTIKALFALVFALLFIDTYLLSARCNDDFQLMEDIQEIYPGPITPVGQGPGEGWEKISEGAVGMVVIRGYFGLEPPPDAEWGITYIYATDPQSGDICEYQPSSGTWTKIGGPGKMFVANGNIGTDRGNKLYALSPDGSGVWQYDNTPMKWTKIRGSAAKICAGGDSFYSTDPQTGDLYSYMETPFSWNKIGGQGYMFAANMVYLYAISPDKSSVWQYGGLPMDWMEIGGPSAGIYAGGDELFSVNPDTGDIYEYKGSYFTAESKPFTWEKIGGPGKMFAVDCHGNLFGLSSDESGIWQYDGTPMKWTKIGGPASEIYAGGNKVLLAKDMQTDALWRYVV